MKALNKIIVLACLTSLVSASAFAQSEADYHPFLSDKFNIGIGGYFPNIDFSLQVDGTEPGNEIDFDEALNLSDYQGSVALEFQWRFGEKWLLGAQYWSTSTSGGEELPWDVKWGDTTFKEGTFVNGGIGLDIARVFVGREFFTSDNPKHEFGAGFGLHWMNLDAFLEGNVITEDEELGFKRVTAEAAFPLPNIGAWYAYSWSPKWMLSARVDWLSANIGDYSGGLWDANAGVNFQAFDKIGFGLYLQAFSLDVDVDKDDWRGKAEFKQLGPMFTVTATW